MSLLWPFVWRRDQSLCLSLGHPHAVQASYNQFYFAEMNVRSKRHPYFNKKGVMEALAGLNHSRVRTKQVRVVARKQRRLKHCSRAQTSCVFVYCWALRGPDQA